MKWALNVRIARSALLSRCMSGGNFWNLHFQTSVMLWRNLALTLLSMNCMSTVNCKSAPLEAVHEDIVCWDTMMIGF